MGLKRSFTEFLTMVKKSKTKKNKPKDKPGFWGFVDSTTQRTANVINSKEAKKVVDTVNPALKKVEEDRHKEATIAAKAGNKGLLGGLGLNGPLFELIKNPYVLGALAGVGGIIAIKLA